MTENNLIPFGGGQVPWNPSEKRIFREGCKTCLSKNREKAEEIYHSTSSFQTVYKYLRDECKEDVSYSSIRNHMMYHFITPDQTSMIHEYADGLPEWEKIQIDQISALRRNIAMLERELFTLQATNEELQGEKRLKNADIVARVAKVLLDYRTKLIELEKREEPAILVLKALNEILTEEMRNNKEQVVRDVIDSILDKLHTKCHHIEVEMQNE